MGGLQAWWQRYVHTVCLLRLFLVESQELEPLIPVGENLVDCISTAHPALLTKEEVSNVAVPVQVLAPENDIWLTPELKALCNSTIPSLNVDYDYQHFPGLAHGFATRSNQNNANEKRGLERAKNAAVAWSAQFLHMH